MLKACEKLHHIDIVRILADTLISSRISWVRLISLRGLSTFNGPPHRLDFALCPLAAAQSESVHSAWLRQSSSGSLLAWRRNERTKSGAEKSVGFEFVDWCAAIP